jgi:hypothetical protein
LTLCIGALYVRQRAAEPFDLDQPLTALSRTKVRFGKLRALECRTPAKAIRS